MKLNKKILTDILKIFIIIVLATALAYAFSELNFELETILLVFVVANLLIVLETKNIPYGIISGVICAVIYTFMFVEPKMSFVIENKSYFLSIIIFLAVCVVISVMAEKIEGQLKKMKKTEFLNNSVYESSKNLLKLKSPEDIANYEVKNIGNVIDRQVGVALKKRKNFLMFGNLENLVDEDFERFNYALSFNLICGFKEQKYSTLKYKIYPLKSGKTSFGVLLIDCKNADLNKDEKEYIKASMSHIIMALEREKIQDQKEDATEKVEMEKLKNSLVLNASNDIKAPMEIMADKIQFLLENYDSLSDESVQQSLVDIKMQNEKIDEYIKYLGSVSCIENENDVAQVVKQTEHE